MYVIDSSVFLPLIAILWDKLVDIMYDYEFHLLDLTIYEVCNGFWKECVKLHRISLDDAVESCELAVMLIKRAVVRSINDLDIDSVMNIALTNNITVYDASYIALARKLRAPIASNDRDILNTAPKYDLRVYDLDEFLKIISWVYTALIVS